MGILIKDIDELHQNIMWDRGNYEACFKFKPTKIALSPDVLAIARKAYSATSLMITKDTTTNVMKIQGLEVVRNPLMGLGKILISH